MYTQAGIVTFLFTVSVGRWFYTGTTDVFVTPQGTHAKLTTKHWRKKKKRAAVVF